MKTYSASTYSATLGGTVVLGRFYAEDSSKLAATKPGAVWIAWRRLDQCWRDGEVEAALMGSCSAYTTNRDSRWPQCGRLLFREDEQQQEF